MSSALLATADAGIEPRPFVHLNFLYVNGHAPILRSSPAQPLFTVFVCCYWLLIRIHFTRKKTNRIVHYILYTLLSCLQDFNMILESVGKFYEPDKFDTAASPVNTSE